jgi:hypothetical protein
MWTSLALGKAAFAMCAATLCLPVAATVDDLPVDLELVLAVDISASMTPDEQQLQRQGYVDALRSERLLQAVRTGAFGRIAIVYVEWADSATQNIVMPWTLLDTEESFSRFADGLAMLPIGRDFNTSLSQALLFSRGLFDGNGFRGERKVIDISANGPNNRGPRIETARDIVLADGITINGLPIMTRLRWGGGLYSIAGLDFYFEDCVIGGPGAFVVAVRNVREFAATIERKLILEIAHRPGDLILPIADIERPHKMDCMVGEKNGRRLLPQE